MNSSRRRRRRSNDDDEGDTSIIDSIESNYNRLREILLDQSLSRRGETILEKFHRLDTPLSEMEDGDAKIEHYNKSYAFGKKEIEQVRHKVEQLWDQTEKRIWRDKLAILSNHLTMFYFDAMVLYGRRRAQEDLRAFKKELPTQYLDTHPAHISALSERKKPNVGTIIKLLTPFLSRFKLAKVKKGKNYYYYVGKYINGGRTFTHYYETGVTLPWEEKQHAMQLENCTLEHLIQTAVQNGKLIDNNSCLLFDKMFKGNGTFMAVVNYFKRDTYVIPYYDRTSCNLLAFKNGIYVPSIQNSDPEKEDFYRDDFVTWEHVEEYFEGKRIFPMNFIDQNFPVDLMRTTTRAHEIPTPTYDRVHAYQGFEPNVRKTAWTLNGRCFHRHSAKDNWEVCLMRLGPGGVGKSTDTELFNFIFPIESIGAFSNKGSPEFTGENARGKLVVVCDDIGKGWRIDSKFIQSFISGQILPFNIKHVSQIMEKPTCQITMNCNEFPDSLKDSGNSIKRRFIVLIYVKRLKEGDRDNTFLAKVLKELPYIILKWNRAYLESLRDMKEQNITDYWAYCDPYFKKTSEIIHGQSNSLISFLQSECVELQKDKRFTDEEQKELDRAGKGYWMSTQQFNTEYQNYYKRHHLQPESCTWKDPTFLGTLESFGIRYGREYVYLPVDDFTQKRRKMAVFGIRIRREEDDEDNDTEFLEEVKDQYSELKQQTATFMRQTPDEFYKEHREILKKRFQRLEKKLTDNTPSEENKDKYEKLMEEINGFLNKLVP